MEKDKKRTQEDVQQPVQLGTAEDGQELWQPAQQPVQGEEMAQIGMMPRGGVLEVSGRNTGELGRFGPVGRSEIEKAMDTLRKYKAGKANLERRIIENENWWKGRHWEQIKGGGWKNPGDPEPTSGYLFNCIANKHADAMDNYPEPNVLPREQGDEADARILTQILPVVLEQNDYERTYSDMWWYKLKTGTGVTGVFWDSGKNNGLGDIDIRRVDLLNLFWEPGITDIQHSRNLFHVELCDREVLKQRYPWIKDAGGKAAGFDVAEYVYDDTVDTTDKSVVVDWYYKLREGEREVLHYCKFCAGEVLYASQNDPHYAQRGYYDHGKYPFIFDVLFPEEGMPAGFGYVDTCKDAQIYVDKLDQVILKHAVMGARPRFFVKGDGSINEQEYADWTKDFVHYEGNGNPEDCMRPIQLPDLSSAYMTVRTMKVEELKEVSGNRDFSQGGTSSGVTAYSAIAALQEAGSKLSRDMIKSAYRAHAQVCYLVIDLMRQFYDESRYFRIIGAQGQMQFVQFTGRQIAEKPLGREFGLNEGWRMPVFDVRVSAQKASPFSSAVQNERAKELYGLGFFRPDLADQSLAALEMMQFDGIEKVRQRVSQNGTLYQQVQQMQQQMAKMAAIIDATQGTQIFQNMQGAFAQDGQQADAPQAKGKEVQSNSIGAAVNASSGGTAGKAREHAASAASPQ